MILCFLHMISVTFTEISYNPNQPPEVIFKTSREDSFINQNNFTSSDLKYLNSDPEINISVFHHYGPYCHWDGISFDGYYIDLMKLLFQKTGVTLKFIPEDSFSRHNKLGFTHKNIDIVLLLEQQKDPWYSFGGNLQLKLNTIVHHVDVNLISKAKIKNMHPVISKLFNSSHLNHILSKDFLTFKANFTNLPIFTLNEVNRNFNNFTVMDLASYNFFKEKYLYHFRKLHSVNLQDLHTKKINFPHKHLVYAHKNNTPTTYLLKKLEKIISTKEINALQEKWILNYQKPLEELEKKYIILEDSRLNSNVSQKYPIIFSPEEIDYLETIDTLHFVFLQENHPFTRTTNKGHSGLMIDLVKKFESSLHKKINFIPVSNQDDLRKTVNKHRNSFCTIMVNKLSRTNLRLSNPISSYSYAITSKEELNLNASNPLAGKSIGVVENCQHFEKLKSFYPDANFIKVNNANSGMKKLHKNSIHAYIDLEPTLNFYLRRYPKKKIFPPKKLPFDQQNFSFANSNLRPPELTSILEKSYRHIPITEKSILRDKWYTIKVEEVTDYTLLFVVLGFTGTLILFFIYWNGKLKNLNLIIQEKEIISRSLLETTNAVTYHFDYKTMSFQYIAPQITKVTEYTPNEIHTQKDWINLIHEKDREKTQDERDKGLNSKKDFSLEYRLKRKSGQYIWVRELCTPVFESDQLVGSKGLLLNITNEKKHESDIKAAKKAAESANDAKSQFLANMSHEIRTPLNPIIGLAHLALTSNPSFAQVKDYMSKIQVSSKSLLRIINDILDLSKMEANKLSLENIPFDLSQLNERISSLYGVKASEKNISLCFEIDDRVHPYVIGDPLRMEQIIGNLVSNAIKFTEEGYVKFVIKQIENNEHDQNIYFSIVDTGLGIPEDKLGKIFEIFTQADDSNTRTHGGTGLGLNICQKLIQLMGGELKAKSQIGKGSEFYFSLNLKNVEKEKFLKHQETTFSKHSLPKFKPAKILLAEDNLINKQVAEELLKAVNLKLDHVNNGKECIEALKNNHYDILLTDVQMPVMDGFEATRIIRQDKTHKYLPIIAMTAQAFESEKKASLDIGMNDHVTKPIEPIKLYETLAKFLEIEEVTHSEEVLQPEIIAIDINTLDSESGIRRLRGNATLYAEIIQEFQKQNKQVVNELSKNLNNKNLKDCLSKLHQLKGSAANIGAIQLQKDCQILEQTLKENNESKEEFKQFKYTLSKTLNGISNYLNMMSTHDDKNEQPLNTHKLQPIQLINQLEQQIDHASPEAIDTIELLLKVKSIGKNLILSEIKNDLDDYDFKSAALKIKELSLEKSL